VINNKLNSALPSCSPLLTFDKVRNVAIDECIPEPLFDQIITEHGFKTFRPPAGAPDDLVFRLVQQNDLVLITRDHDFQGFPVRESFGVLLLSGFKTHDGGLPNKGQWAEVACRIGLFLKIGFPKGHLVMMYPDRLEMY
jgi:hypothetical protein